MSKRRPCLMCNERKERAYPGAPLCFPCSKSVRSFYYPEEHEGHERFEQRCFFCQFEGLLAKLDAQEILDRELIP